MSIESEQIYQELLRLRMNQVNGKLSDEEQQKLDTALSSVEQRIEEKYGKEVDYNKAQEERWVSFHAYRNYTLQKFEPSRSLLDVILRRPASAPEIEDYFISFDDEGYQEETLQYYNVLKLSYLLEEQGMTCTFSELIPGTAIEYLINEVRLDQEDVLERLQNPKPQWSLEKLEQLSGLEDELEGDRELQDMVIWLKEMWRNDYQVIADYDIALKLRVPEE
ncbi:hypothetical protein [Geomicrobium sediminis]|uniref:Uncharacterized protein n=1 Tax=Geomicrobium sediminis TaxID=1347788 RepID=A0ABS2PCI7_9BACL|nr:hypothetical protein [Geomicrobium sediminis]MBM7632770.1 hypothetical protein [Geomicrobium sediminis]